MTFARSPILRRESPAPGRSRSITYFGLFVSFCGIVPLIMGFANSDPELESERALRLRRRVEWQKEFRTALQAASSASFSPQGAALGRNRLSSYRA